MTTLRDTNLSQNLDLTGKTLLLPIETDSVLHYADRAAFPLVGRLKRIYIAEDTAAHWHWTGTTYQISAPTTDEFATLEGTVTAAEEEIAALQATVATADRPSVFSPTPPPEPFDGQRWTDTFDLTTYEWFGGAWVEKPNNH